MIVALIGTGLFNPAVSAVALGSVAAGAERPGRRRQRHVPPGRHRGRRRRARRADPGRRARSAATPSAYVDGMHDALWVGAALCAAGAVACAALLVERRKPATTGELAIDAA